MASSPAVAPAGQPDVVAFNEPQSAIAEAYRALRTNVQFASVDEPLRRLLVTSSGPDEGKSTTVANLAVVMAQADMKVVVVDCDLRRPSQHTLFNVPNNEGLTTLFLGRSGTGSGSGAASTHMEPPLQRTALPSLSILTSGPLPPNPAELLGSARMDAILDELARRADVVLLDSPPIVAVTDAAVLCAKVDGCLLVIGTGIAKRDHVRRAKAQLEAVHAKVVGVVATNVAPDSDAFVPYGAAQA